VNFNAAVKRIRFGFHPNFWIANGMELFERLAYYSQRQSSVFFSATICIFLLPMRENFNRSLAG